MVRATPRKPRVRIQVSKPGFLTSLGYSMYGSMSTRRAALNIAVRKYGYKKTMYKVNALYVWNKNKRKGLAAIARADKNWLKSKYGRSRSPSRRRKSRRKSRRRKSRRKSRRRSRRRKSRRKSRRRSRRRRSRSRRARMSMCSKKPSGIWTVYTLSTCPHCKEAKKLLHSKGYKFREIECSKIKEEVNKKFGGHRTYPKVVDPSGTFIGGRENLETHLK